MAIYAVGNYSGNIGKTTIAVEILAACSESPILSVESYNEGAADGAVEVRASNGMDVMEWIAQGRNCVIDMGSSDLASILAAFGKTPGAADDVDLWVVPTTGEEKVLRDTERTVRDIKRSGVSPDRIAIVANRIRSEAPEDAHRIAGLEGSLGVPVVPHVVYETDIFAAAAKSRVSVKDWAADATDYRTAARRGDTEDERLAAARKLIMVRQARFSFDSIERIYEWLAART